MYWSHKRDETKSYLIESSALDGSNRQVLINCTDPADSLAMDFTAGRLYYVYEQSGAILYVDLKTKVVQEILVPGTGFKISSVTVYKDDIYFAEIADDTIRKCSKNDCKTSEVLRNSTGMYFVEFM